VELVEPDLTDVKTAQVDRNGMAVLSLCDCMKHLGRAGFGRIAITIGALPAIFPVNYAVRGGDIYFRTAPGTKLAAAARNTVVAFEVDHVERLGHTGWSVLAVGVASEVTDPGELDRLTSLPLSRGIDGRPETVVRIHPELVSGRAITNLSHAPRHTDRWLFSACPACGSDALRPVWDGDMANIVCTSCLCCWHSELGGLYQIPWATCPGCEIADVCRAAHAT